MVQSHPDEKRGTAHARELCWLEFYDMRILLGDGETLDIDACASDRLDQRFQIRRRGHYAQLLRKGPPWRRYKCERQDQSMQH